MGYILSGLIRAGRLLLTGNPETYSAVFTTLKVTSLSVSGSLLIGLPLGFLLGYFDFPGKKQLRALADTLLALPTVVVGLFVYAFISSKGPFGRLALLFTIQGIVLAQCLLILPIVVSLTAAAIEGLDRRLKNTLLTLGARKRHIVLASLMEARYAVMTAAVAAYGRAISEVGVSMMIGGNIKWYTRTITTAIALETGKGDFETGFALGIVLLFIAFIVNWALILLRRKS